MVKRYYFILALIILLGIILRWYKLDALMYFSGDEGRDLLAIRDIIVYQKLPLLGPSTSLGWFRLGPFVYYLFTPVLYLGNFNPVTIAMFVAFIDTLGILILFNFVKEIFGYKTAITTSLFYASSPMSILYSRTPLHIGLMTFFSLFFIFAFWRFLDRRGPYYFYLSCFLLGLLIQIHLTALILIFIFFVKLRKKIDIYQFLLGILLFLLPLILWLIADVLQGFFMLRNLLLWVPYRFLSLFGIFADKNILTTKRTIEILSIMTDSWQRTIFIGDKVLAVVLVVLGLVFLIYSSIKQGSRHPKQVKGIRFILLIVSITLLSICLHGQPAGHYFNFLTPLIILSVIYLLRQKKIGILVVFILISLNIYFLTQLKFMVGIPFLEQKKIMEQIIATAGYRKYQIEPPLDIVGLPDYYKNYQYLGWWIGNEPTENTAGLKFTIYQRKDNIVPLKLGEELIEFPHVVVVQSG